MDRRLLHSSFTADESADVSDDSTWHLFQASSSARDSRASAAQKVPGPQVSFIWRGVNLLMATFMSLAAYVQINDPDPYIWVPVYLIPSVLSLAIVIKPSVVDSAIWRSVCLIHLSLSVVGAAYLLTVVLDLLTKETASFLVYEEAREFIGVIIVVVWLSIVRFSSVGCLSRSDANRALISASLAAACIVGAFPLVFWSLCFVGSLRDRLDHCSEMQTAHHHHHHDHHQL